MNQTKQFYVFAMAATGQGVSGGDRIFIEFLKNWQKNVSINLYVWEEGVKMCERVGLKQGNNLRIHLIKNERFNKWGFFVCYLTRILTACLAAFSIKLENNQSIYIYSASEFWMDSIPVLILKLRFPKVIWVASWYQTAPNPMIGFSEGKRKNNYKLNALFYWLVQLPIKPLVHILADFVLINNEEEKKQFPKLAKKDRTIIVQGAVDLLNIKNWYRKNNEKNLPKIYDGVFEGRFHPQKGVLELIDIWKLVVNKKPDAKLVMIGDGPLMKDIKLKIKSEKLEEHVKLTGYLFDGEEKYKIFSQSRIVVHPAFYDSGGMSTAEAMAFGLPGVGFDLKSFTSYYPKGLIKVEIGNLVKFAYQVLDLLQNKKVLEKTGKEAKAMVWASWGWDQRAKEVLLKLGKDNIITNIKI